MEDKKLGVNPSSISDSKKDWRNCRQCGSTPKDHVMKNFDPRAREADIYCKLCGAFVRDWNP